MSRKIQKYTQVYSFVVESSGVNVESLGCEILVMDEVESNGQDIAPLGCIAGS